MMWNSFKKMIQIVEEKTYQSNTYIIYAGKIEVKIRKTVKNIGFFPISNKNKNLEKTQ